MTHTTGQRLIGVLETLREETAWTIAASVGKQSTWRLSGETWSAEIVVDPGVWIGLTFDALAPVTGRKIHHFCNTDLYRFPSDQPQDFARDVENDIIDFLEHLRRGRVMRGNDGATAVMTFPRDGAYRRVAAGRFLTTASTVDEPPQDYLPVA